MTADYFDMHPRSYINNETVWRLDIHEGQTEIVAHVYEDAIRDCLENQMYRFADMMRDYLSRRAESLLDCDTLTEDEARSFKELLKKVIP